MNHVHTNHWLLLLAALTVGGISCEYPPAPETAANNTNATSSTTNVTAADVPDATTVPAGVGAPTPEAPVAGATPPVAAAPNAAAPTSDVAPLAGPRDWNQWGGSAARNNTPQTTDVPAEWDIDSGKNIKWVSPLGSQSYGNAVICNGQIYVGTNNGAGLVKRYPKDVDLGCLVCIRESDGKFLWQHSNEKLPQGRVNDWQFQGVCCAPLAEGKRLWYVSNRGEVCCLDAEGFYDGENDGPYTDEPNENQDEADVIWKFDMMAELGLFQHNMCSCSVTGAGDMLFVNTSNGVDETHITIPAPNCPSFICLNKNTGELLWGDDSPGLNILHGQWSSPAYAVLGGVPQVIFGAGDGFVYSFNPNNVTDGKPEFLWKFDANPKESKWILSGRGTRNNIIGTPVVYNGLIYVAVGQDPEHAEGEGHLWCIDPTKRGDVSPQLVVSAEDPTKVLPHRRLQACIPENGERAVDNPNSAAVWHYNQHDINGNGEIDDFVEELHRTPGTVAIKDDILYLADFSGLFHCVNAKTGVPYWTYDMLSCAWGSPLIVDGKVFIGDEDGDIAVFAHSADPNVAMPGGNPLAEIYMGNSVYSTPVVANGVLFIANKSQLFAIEAAGQ